MKSPGARFAGLGTRVAARTFALFCLCAIVPIVVSALVADRMVRSKLRNDAATRLETTSKSYGLLVFERLRQTDEALAEIASLGLAGRLTLDDIRTFHSAHFKVVSAALAAAQASARLPPNRAATLTLHGTEVHLTVIQDNGPRRLQITATMDSAYLWSPDAVYLDATRICVRSPSGDLL